MVLYRKPQAKKNLHHIIINEYNIDKNINQNKKFKINFDNKSIDCETLYQ